MVATKKKATKKKATKKVAKAVAKPTAAQLALLKLAREECLKISIPKEPKKARKKASEKEATAIRVAEAIGASGFGCQRENVRRVFSALLDTKLPAVKGKRGGSNKVGQVFVVHSNIGAHSYKIGTIVMACSRDFHAVFRREDGTRGNFLDTPRELRAPTAAQVNALFAKIAASAPLFATFKTEVMALVKRAA